MYTSITCSCSSLLQVQDCHPLRGSSVIRRVKECCTVCAVTEGRRGRTVSASGASPALSESILRITRWWTVIIPFVTFTFLKQLANIEQETSAVKCGVILVDSKLLHYCLSPNTVPPTNTIIRWRDGAHSKTFTK